METIICLFFFLTKMNSSPSNYSSCNTAITVHYIPLYCATYSRYHTILKLNNTIEQILSDTPEHIKKLFSLKKSTGLVFPLPSKFTVHSIRFQTLRLHTVGKYW